MGLLWSQLDGFSIRRSETRIEGKGLATITIVLAPLGAKDTQLPLTEAP
jgi:hypothetical protein